MSTQSQYVIKESVALRHSGVSIRPYVSGRPNFGLEQFNMVVADGVRHRAGISVMGTGKVKEYITGLNENSEKMKALAAAAVTSKEKAEEYQAKIKEIRTIVARAERELFANYDVDPADPKIVEDTKFWSKVKKLHSVIDDKYDHKGDREQTFWDDLTVELDNHGFALDSKNMNDILLIKAIEEGGVALVAPNLDTAKNSNRYKFYLHKTINAAAIQVSDKKMRDKAGQELIKLEKDPNKMFYVTKLVSLDSIYYKKGGNTTPADVLYYDCSLFLDGEGKVKNKEEAAKQFIEIAKMELEELKYRCMVQDGISNRYLSYKTDGTIYYLDTSTPMGKNVHECIIFLRDPLNESIYKALLEKLEKDWSS